MEQKKWLSPELANSFCLDALKLDDDRKYGDFHKVHLGLRDDFAGCFVIQDLFYLGETRSVEDFGTFHRMPPERLCLWCGVRSDETFSLLLPHDRSCAVLSEVPFPDETEDERVVKVALTPFFFLELMPCALEALTVILSSVVGQLFSGC